ncbi:glycoside hydrolase family 6 protein [Frigoribacterium sp. UYMn621]|uniref:glycoside hydrolase family 6 protein n=1 Tax=Frigoribacterium sp. UYMn621 TaxID=3156343 RepID=UPI003399504F
MSRSERPRRPALTLSIVLLSVAVVCLGTVLVAKAFGGSGAAVRPGSADASNAAPSFLAGKGLYVDPDSSAARASMADPSVAVTFAPLAHTPTAIWLTPEKYPTVSVETSVARIVRDATAKKDVASFVVYGIPNRDCGSQSSGGLDQASYPAWVAAIAKGVEGSKSIVVLEPDSLAQSASCGEQDARIIEVRNAASQFSGTSPEVYLDGGHSNWLPAATMADLLNRAGVSSVRGFATNVSNYNATERERNYASTVSKLTGGAHYIIDVSRNGAGSNGDWCNPPGRRIGTTPSIDHSNNAHDGDLWIKPPGESDGTCNGGPAAGQWWAQSALELLGLGS